MRYAIAADFEHDPTFAQQRAKGKMLLGWAINRLNEEERTRGEQHRSWLHIYRQALHWGAIYMPDGKKHHHGCPQECDGFYRVCPTGDCTCGGKKD